MRGVIYCAVGLKGGTERLECMRLNYFEFVFLPSFLELISWALSYIK
jgi:hypothetical protein